jgi:hypothetical protein
MPLDPIDPSLNQLAQQHWQPSPLPGDVHQTPQTGHPGTLQGSIEESGQQPPQWMSNANEWLINHKDLVNLVKSFSEGLPGPTEFGMYKLVPQEMTTGTYGSYHLLDHNDNIVADLNGVWMDPDGHLHIWGLYSKKASPLPSGSRAKGLNFGAWSLSPEDKVGLGHALLKEFPESKTISGFRGTGAKQGREQPIPYRHFLDEDAARREVENLPHFPEMESGLADIVKNQVNRAGKPLLHISDDQLIVEARRRRLTSEELGRFLDIMSQRYP